MKHIRVIRDKNDIGQIILDSQYIKLEKNPDEIRQDWFKLFEKTNFQQVAYCVETGDILCAVDEEGYLQVAIPEYKTVTYELGS